MTNFSNMMKQAQDLKKKMSEVQKKLKSIEVIGSAGGGIVEVIANAKGEIKKIKLDPSLMKAEEKDIAEDLILAAVNDAKNKAEEAAANEMKNLTGGISLPPGMKLPF